MTAKTADAKGRVVLGPQFAGQTVIVEQVDETEVRVTLAAVVPQREMWLKRNAKARNSIARGLTQAGEGQFAKMPPALDRDAALAKRIDD